MNRLDRNLDITITSFHYKEVKLYQFVIIETKILINPNEDFVLVTLALTQNIHNSIVSQDIFLTALLLISRELIILLNIN